ncbi:MAG: SAM-dependent methyltransferase [Planctomycetota bacterium]
MPIPILSGLSRWRRAVSHSLKVHRILSRDFGHFRSIRTGESADRDGRPVPWFTYPMIEFLDQIDLSQYSVFEYGSGNSTMYWAKHARQVVAVEDHRGWYERMKPLLPANVEYRFREGDAYPAAIGEDGDRRFDIVVIDGTRRLSCAKAALVHTKPSGCVIVDNSAWVPKTTAVVREAGFIQVDMNGFAPVAKYSSATSIFIGREAQFRPRHAVQPTRGIGGVPPTHDRRDT